MERMIGPAIKTTCPYCGVGCGVIARPKPDGGVEISGDPDHRRISAVSAPRDRRLPRRSGSGDRLLHPGIGGRRAGWDEALDSWRKNSGPLLPSMGRIPSPSIFPASR